MNIFFMKSKKKRKAKTRCESLKNSDDA